jgi:hypothetical protein
VTTQKKHNCCPKALCTQCNTPRMPFYHATYPPCPQRIRKNRPHNKDTSSTTTVPKRLAYKAQADIQYSVVAVHLFSHSVSPGNSSTTSLAFVWWLLGADLAFYGGQIAAMQQHPQPFPTTQTATYMITYCTMRVCNQPPPQQLLALLTSMHARSPGNFHKPKMRCWLCTFVAHRHHAGMIAGAKQATTPLQPRNDTSGWLPQLQISKRVTG